MIKALLIAFTHWFLIVSGPNIDTQIIPMVSKESCYTHGEYIVQADSTMKVFCYETEQGNS